MNRGIALLTALFSLVLILIVGSLSLFLVMRSMGVSTGQARYQSAFEATEGGVERGLAEVDEAFDAERTDFVVGTYSDALGPNQVFAITTRPQLISTVTVTGGALDFARGYEGIGASIAKGGSMTCYIIPAEGTGPTSIKVDIDVSVKKTRLGGG